MYNGFPEYYSEVGYEKVNPVITTLCLPIMALGLGLFAGSYALNQQANGVFAQSYWASANLISLFMFLGIAYCMFSSYLAEQQKSATPIVYFAIGLLIYFLSPIILALVIISGMVATTFWLWMRRISSHTPT